MERLLITGAGGQVGHALTGLAERHGFEAVALSSSELDVTDRDVVKRVADDHLPAAVVNAAAYTAVDKAEEDEDRAQAVNADGPTYLAEAFEGVPLLHFSTDYVFDGRGDQPYTEEDETRPLGVYGRTKLEGEHAVLERGGTVMRTAWVYSDHGANFLKTMLRVGGERGAVRVVNDQHGTPTHAADIAEAALRVLRRQVDEGRGTAGLYHYTASGQTTWYGFATAIFGALMDRAGRHVELTPIPSSDYPTPAARPAWSVLDTIKIEETFGVTCPEWYVPVPSTVEAVLEETT